MIDKEDWLPVRGYENNYLVSSLGRIKAIKRNIIKKDRRSPDTGYNTINLWLNGVPTCFLVHRLVAIHFIENPDEKREVNHKNGIKTDNRVVNLEWVTPSENMDHAYKTGLQKISYGEDRANATMTNELVLSIFNDPLPYKKLSEKYNIPIYNIYQIKNGQNWSNLTGKKYISLIKKRSPEEVLEIFTSTLSRKDIYAKYKIHQKQYWEIKSGKRFSAITKHLRK